MIAEWPRAVLRDPHAEGATQLVREAITSVRAVRSECRVDASAYIGSSLGGEADTAIFQENATINAAISGGVTALPKRANACVMPCAKPL